MNGNNDKAYMIPKAAPALERGPTWLRKKRRLARDMFNSMPLPRRGLHLWRYTDPARFLSEHDKTADTAFNNGYDSMVKSALYHVDQGLLSGLVVDFGGRKIIRYGGDGSISNGVVILPLSEAAATHSDLVEEHLYQLVNDGTGKFEAMNGALWNDGIFIYVPNGVTVKKPLHLLREAGLAGSSVYPRLLVIVGQNAELTLIDEYGGGSTDLAAGLSYSNGAVEVFGLQDSRVRYVSLQRQGHATASYLTHRARIARGATMLTIPLAFGASLSKENFGVALNGDGADSKMYGLAFGAGRQHFDNHTLHHHAHSRTTSNIDFKVVLRDRAVSAYTGLIRIDQHAKTCEAYQENRNLLLTPGSKADSIPELEILNEDVSCSHGATVGQIDPLAVFYLTSRGIEHDPAVRMIISGFVAPTLNQLPDDLQERIAGFVTQRLEDL